MGDLPFLWSSDNICTLKTRFDFDFNETSCNFKSDVTLKTQIVPDLWPLLLWSGVDWRWPLLSPSLCLRHPGLHDLNSSLSPRNNSFLGLNWVLYLVKRRLIYDTITAFLSHNSQVHERKKERNLFMKFFYASCYHQIKIDEFISFLQVKIVLFILVNKCIILKHIFPLNLFGAIKQLL